MFGGQPDPKNHLETNPSLISDAVAGSENGAWTAQAKEAGLPQTWCCIQVLPPSGNPDDFSVTVSIDEADDDSGTNSQDVEDIHETSLGVFADSIVITEAGTHWVNFEANKPYLRPTVVRAFTNGTSPKVPVAVSFVTQPQEWPQ